jgi:hypothetical protein
MALSDHENGGTMTLTDEQWQIVLQAARAYGEESGRCVASWVDINESNAALILQGWEDGDPEVLDAMPAGLDLSQEWSGEPTAPEALQVICEDAASHMDMEWEDSYTLTPEEEDEVLTEAQTAADDALWNEIQRRCKGYTKA